MRFYRVTWVSEGDGDGFAKQYFSSKRKATKFMAGLRKEATTEKIKELESGDYLDAAEIQYARDRILKSATEFAWMDTLEFEGTPKEMVLEALRRGGS